MTKQSMEYRNLGEKLEINPRAELLERRAPRTSPAEALELLHEKLAIDTVVYESHGDGGRAGAWRALTDVIDYLRDQGLPLASLLPLSGMATAMADGERRVSSPLFAVERSPGKPPKPIAETIVDQFLAVVMECCARHYRDAKGVSSFLGPASRHAANIINASANCPRITAKRLLELRETISEKPTKDIGRETFDLLMREASKSPSSLQWAEGFVRAKWPPAPKLSG